jgi:cysteine desulfurase
MRIVNLDSSASTPVLDAVWEAMRPHLTGANAASAHRAGRGARQALEDARERTASLLGAVADEIIFTSGATEANNLALFGLAGDAPGRILASPIEHPCVHEPLQQLQRRGFAVEWLEVDASGVVRCEERLRQPPADTRLIAVMLANHETGAVQPVSKIAQHLAGRVALHCDAAAAVGKIAVDFHGLEVTSLTISAHKFHGPQGIGALLVRRGAKLRPLLFGGHQQHALRPGTEPVALAVGLATALELATAEQQQRWQHVSALRQTFLDYLQRHALPVVVNGQAEDALPHTLNLSFPGCQADVLLMSLDLAGVCCSTGSACSSGSLLPSPVLKAMGVSEQRLRSAMRFSFSHLLSEAEVLEAAQHIAAAVQRLRG